MTKRQPTAILVEPIRQNGLARSRGWFTLPVDDQGQAERFYDRHEFKRRADALAYAETFNLPIWVADGYGEIQKVINH